jgi:hypothetical protein
MLEKGINSRQKLSARTPLIMFYVYDDSFHTCFSIGAFDGVQVAVTREGTWEGDLHFVCMLWSCEGRGSILDGSTRLTRCCLSSTVDDRNTASYIDYDLP